MDEQKIFKRDMPQDMADAALGKVSDKQKRLDEVVGLLAHLNDRCRLAESQLKAMRIRMYGAWPEPETDATKEPEPCGTLEHIQAEIRRMDNTFNRVMEHIEELKEL